MSASELARSVLLSSGGTTNRLEPDGGGRARQEPTPLIAGGVPIELTTRGRGVIDAAIDAHLAL